MTRYLLNTLPNTGSTWLGDIVGRALRDHGHGDYHLEFFNPAQNEPLESELAERFGCEIISCYRNIATWGGPLLAAHIRELWPARLVFTKEVFSPLKLDAFVAAGFRCAVLRRYTDGVFPPKRGRVWAFYEALYFSLEAEELVSFRTRPSTMRERARAAHAYATRRMENDAFLLDVPIIRYADLFADEATISRALRPWGLPPDVERQVVREIIATRVAKQGELVGATIDAP